MDRIQRIRNKRWRCKQIRKYKEPPNLKNNLSVAPNRVRENELSNIPTDKSWLNLADLRKLINGDWAAM
ncbi:MAG: hypothetical protein ABIO31_03620 [Candidatus Nitrotoga sp.]